MIHKLSRFFYYLFNKPSAIVDAVLFLFSPIISDKLYLKIKFWIEMGYWMNFSEPMKFNEKLQWLKLYDRKPEYTKMVDKIGAKELVAERIGEEYIIPTIGVYDTFDEINFDSLPNQFVIKCSHDSGGTYVCQDKLDMNIDFVRKKINKSLKSNYYRKFREWPYKNVKPRIIIEKYMEDESGDLADYKFSCFNGNAHNVMICYDRKSNDTKFYFFNRKWELLRYNKRGLIAPENFTLPKPKELDKMFDIAEKLSKSIPYARIDLYNINGQIYFGEITFYPQSGFDSNLLEETDKLFGNLINIDNI